jgi:DNA-binding winged helix-turn-helix (wHTH) protein
MAAFTFDNFVYDDVQLELARGGAPLKVDAQLLRLLGFLVRNPARLVTNEELITEVWQGRALGNNIISVSVAKLRKVLGAPTNRGLSNVYGRGYRFLRPVKVSTHSTSAPQRAVVTSLGTSGQSQGRSGPFVGRNAAIRRLESALESARAGRGGLCALLGEAGIGKTRLAEALEQRALSAGVHVAWGHCHAFGDAPPLWPWSQVLRSNRSQRALQSNTTLAWLDEVVSCVRAAPPWLIVLEDLQWADVSSLQLLTYLVAEVSHLPALIVVTARDAELPASEEARRALEYVLGHCACERIPLWRLQEADVEAYTRELWGPSEPELTEAILRKSDGNPFFMVEVLRPWLNGDAPRARDLTLTGPSLDVVRQTLRRFTPEAVEVLAAAAVIGNQIDLGVLAAVTYHRSDELIELLDPAMKANVCVALNDDRIHFAFGHDVIRSALYEDLTSAARMRLHQRVADVLQTRLNAGHAVSNVEFAHHLLSALPAGDSVRAISWAERAARAAQCAGAYAEAGAFLRRALDALHLQPVRDPAVACNLLIELAYCERGAGEPFAAHIEQAVAIAREHALGGALARVAELMSCTPGILSLDGASRVIEAALELLPEEDSQRRAAMLAHLSWSPPYCDDAARVGALLDQAESLASGAADAARRTVLRARMYYAGGPDDSDASLSIAAEMERAAAPRGAKQRAWASLESQLARIVGMLQCGEIAQARRAADVFGEAAHELNHAELIWHHDRMRAVLSMNAGDYAQARELFVDLKRRAERLQPHGHRALEAFDWSELFRQSPDVEPLEPRHSSQLQPDAADSLGVRALKLRSLVHLGLQQDVAIALRALPVTAIYALPKSRDYLATLCHLAFASAAAGALDHAAALYELLTPYPHCCVAAVSLHHYGVVSHFLAILARALGQRAKALGHCEDALLEHARLGLQPQLAYSRYELASLLLEPGGHQNAERARRLLQQVCETATRLGMKPLRLSARRLRRATQRPQVVESSTHRIDELRPRVHELRGLRSEG